MPRGPRCLSFYFFVTVGRRQSNPQAAYRPAPPPLKANGSLALRASPTVSRPRPRRL